MVRMHNGIDWICSSFWYNMCCLSSKKRYSLHSTKIVNHQETLLFSYKWSLVAFTCKNLNRMRTGCDGVFGAIITKSNNFALFSFFLYGLHYMDAWNVWFWSHLKCWRCTNYISPCTIKQDFLPVAVAQKCSLIVFTKPLLTKSKINGNSAANYIYLLTSRSILMSIYKVCSTLTYYL